MTYSTKYVTLYSVWCMTVENGLRDQASISDMDAARRALAYRADRVPSERKGLQRRYDELLRRMLAKGWS